MNVRNGWTLHSNRVSATFNNFISHDIQLLFCWNLRDLLLSRVIFTGTLWLLFFRGGQIFLVQFEVWCRLMSLWLCGILTVAWSVLWNIFKVIRSYCRRLKAHKGTSFLSIVAIWCILTVNLIHWWYLLAGIRNRLFALIWIHCTATLVFELFQYVVRLFKHIVFIL